jgi:hypothetical protein
MQRRFIQLSLVFVALGSAVALPWAGGAATDLTLVGTNYSHMGLSGCDFSGQGIVANGTFARLRTAATAVTAAGATAI